MVGSTWATTNLVSTSVDHFRGAHSFKMLVNNSIINTISILDQNTSFPGLDIWLSFH